MSNLLWVAGGGALGALGRYGISVLLANNIGKIFPFATLLVNILGSFLLAALFAWCQYQDDNHHQVWLFLGVGMLGAFTTFSTFSLEVVLLAEQGAYLKAALHAGLNFSCCIAAVLIALWLKPYYLFVWD